MTAYDIAARLPSIDVLRRRCQALAVLDLVLGGPVYAYTRAWGEDEAALMDNGSGDEWAVVFTAAGAFIRVFDHESGMSPYGDPDHELWPGLVDGLPAQFEDQLAEPAFADEDDAFVATAVLWRLAGDDRWHAGEGIDFPPSRGPYDTDPDGTGMLEILLDDITDRYAGHATDYHGIAVDRAAVDHIVRHEPLTDRVVQALNPGATLDSLRSGLEEIGYPI